jgi:hypothetical protein
MRHARTVLAAVLASVGLALAAESGPALQSVFNGSDLAGWRPPEPNLWWRVVDGILVGENDEKLKGSMLRTEADYGDVLIEADVRWSGEIDSGIMLRKPELQVQIGVSRSLKRDMTGSIYVGKYPETGQAKQAGELLRVGDWNTLRIEARGPRFTVWLNGAKVVTYEDPKYAAPGPIGLQIHGGLPMKVEFRNLRAVALPLAPTAAE